MVKRETDETTWKATVEVALGEPRSGQRGELSASLLTYVPGGSVAERANGIALIFNVTGESFEQAKRWARMVAASVLFDQGLSAREATIYDPDLESR